MNPASTAPFDVAEQLSQTSHSDEYFKLLFDHFAERVDRHIQTDLYAQLMARYADVSKTLENTVQMLTRSDTLRRQAEDIAMLGNWTVDPQTEAIEWSDTMYTIFGIDRSRKPELSEMLQRVHPDDRAMVADASAEVFAGKPPQNITYRLRMPDGSTKWVYAQHMVQHNRLGEVQMLYGTLQDVTQVKQTERKLQRYNDDLEAMVQEKANELFASQVATIHALVKLAESRDDDTGEHIERMSRYSQYIAQALQQGSPYADAIDDAFVRNIAMASPLHDIGKVGIPDGILLKPGRLSADEFAIMKTHVTIGYDTLASVNQAYPGNGYLTMGMDIARYHHEKWDGSGYMDGLRGQEIPLSARILTLCDVYDALRSRRVYKEPFTHEKSVGIILEGKGTHFDPTLIDLFAAQHTAFEAIYNSAAHD